MNVNTTDGHSGTGWAFGVGAGLDATGGTLGYTSWEDLKSEQNTIGIVATEDVLTITFALGLTPVGVFVGAGIGAIEAVAGGFFNWN